MYRMMIVDDERFVVEGIRDTIPWQEYQVEVGATASDGVEALEKLRIYHPEIIIVDIRMPGMDGLAFIEKAKTIVPGIHFIVISAFEQFSYAQRAIELGVRFYLVKPIQELEIIEKVRQCIAELQSAATIPPDAVPSEVAAQYIVGCWLTNIHVTRERLVQAFERLSFPHGQDFYALALIRPADPAQHPPVQQLGGLVAELHAHLNGVLRHYLLIENIHATTICLFTDNDPFHTVHLRLCRTLKALSLQMASRYGLPLLVDILPQACSLQECPAHLAKMLAQTAPLSKCAVSPTTPALTDHYAEENSFRNRVVRNACRYMDSRAFQDISLIDVAEHVFVTPTYLSALFKQEMGLSFIEYLKKHRIERAKQMLRETNLKVYEICTELGYKSVQYFSTLFRESVGMTPVEYRENGCKSSRLPRPPHSLV